MRRVVAGSLLTVALLALSTVPTNAEELTASSILTAQKAGATTDGIIAMVNDPANGIVMTDNDLVTLRTAGVSEALIAAIQVRIPTLAGVPARLQPDDSRLVDLARLIKSGVSELIVTEQVRLSGETFHLSVNDVLYLKQNGVLESTINALMATSPRAATPPEAEPAAGAPAVPEELVFDGLVMKTSFMKRNRPGRLVMRGDALVWTDGADPKESFEFQTTGLEKVWFTCQARTPENFCYQINFQIVKGARYQFQDVNRESGSNAAVIEVMDALRTRFPQIAYGSPKN